MNTANETRQLGKSLAAVAFVLWGVFPMLVLGWLLAAIGRHQEAEDAIKDEAVYFFLLRWKGGTDTLVTVLLLMLFLAGLIVLSYWLRKNGYSKPHDGMSNARSIVQKLLIPSFLSSMAFAIGLLSEESLSGLLWSVVTLIGMGVFAGGILFLTNITKKVN